jgi:hypothetical protein
MIIQILLCLGFLGIIAWLLINRKSAKGKAWQKIGLIGLLVLAIVAVLFPDSLNRLAHFLGVGRGADLVFYTFVFAFIAYVTTQYIKQKDHDRQVAILVRKVAIIEANERVSEKRLDRISKT